MKRILILMAVLFSVQYVNAQFGIRAGLNSTATQIDEILQNADGLDEYKVSAAEARVGFHFGLMGRINLGNLYVAPELLFSSINSQMNVEDLINGGTKLADQSYKKIDVPILVGRKFGPDGFALRLEVGPVASFMLSSESSLTEITKEEVKEDVKTATWGFQVGVGVDLFEKIGVGVRYEGGLSSLGEGVTIAGKQQTFDARTQQWILSLAYYF
jgi:hypothetical protein